MEGNVILLTAEGYEELVNELNNLKSVIRKEIAEKIKVALAFGDISENSEYDEAKKEQANIEKRISKLEAMLKHAKIIEEHNERDTVGIGCRVSVKDIEFDEIMEFNIVGSAEADPFKGKISNVSPLGKALLGKRIGDTVEVKSPNGEDIIYEILSL